MIPTPTPEQLSIISAATSTTDNLLLSAVPGSGKTTTLELICRALPVAPILSVAFNKRIVEEMTPRLPGHVVCKTLNSVGHRAWSTVIGKRLNLDTKKSYRLLTEAIRALPRDDKDTVYEVFQETLAAVRSAKLRGYIPSAAPGGQSLINSKDFYSSLEDEVPSRLVDAVLCESIREAYSGTIDFDDQVFMPTLFGGTFPRFPTVLVDEAQDLSVLNLSMLERLCSKARLFAVGDPFQSIYAFRGAHMGAMDYLRKRFSMRELPLSVSFRCPEAIVRNVHFRAPHMKWVKEGGKVESLGSLAISDIQDGSAFLCRNNSPLFALALRLLSGGRGVTLAGTDLGPNLIKSLKKLGPETLTQQETLDAIDQWEEENLAKGRKEESIRDKAECLRVFARFGATLSAAIAYAEHIFNAKGPIQLLSGHKSKGLEWNSVYHLDPYRIPSKFSHGPDEIEQELNLKYVIRTRAKAEYYEIDLENIH